MQSDADFVLLLQYLLVKQYDMYHSVVSVVMIATVLNIFFIPK